MKTIMLIAMLAACGTDGPGAAGNGNDVLPKRGTLASDPTIVAATGRCYTDVETHMTYVELKISGSDPSGTGHLSTCAATVGDATDSDTFGDSGTGCIPRVAGACAIGMRVVADITVANDTGGVTTASTTVTLGESF